MKRSILPAILVTSLLLSACSATPSQNQTPDPAPAPVKTQPQTPVNAPAPDTQSPPAPNPPVQNLPVQAPAAKPSSGASGEPQAPVQVPAVTWTPRGIGLPLVPSDPAADQKVMLLTFDDGPSEYTVPILETLAKENIKAIFFITGYGARNHPELVERIHKEGHILAVHTMTHPNMRRLTKDGQRQEIQPLVELIEKVSGQKPRYFRPPFGAYNDDLRQLLMEMDMELINWTNGSKDWEGVVNGYKDPNKVVEDVMQQLHKGAVVLFHDTMQHTVEAVPEVIKRVRAEGYEFVTLP